MDHPYIVSMLETQFRLQEHIEEVDQALTTPLSNKTYNQLVLARAGLTSDLSFLVQMIKQAERQIEKGELQDPSVEELLFNN